MSENPELDHGGLDLSSPRKDVVEIREFEIRARRAVDDFFEDYKNRALKNKEENPLRRSVIDWLDEFVDFVSTHGFHEIPVLTVVPDVCCCGYDHVDGIYQLVEFVSECRVHGAKNNA